MVRQLNLYNETGVDIEKIRQSVVNELNREESWLMVLDNVDEVDLVKTILPEKRIGMCSSPHEIGRCVLSYSRKRFIWT